MHLWPLTPDALRELDTDGRQVRRLEGIALPTEREGRDGSWHAYFRVTSPVVVGEPIEITWPARGRAEVSLRSTIAAPVVAVLDQQPRGPWNWAAGDEAGRSGLVSLEGRPVALAPDIEAAFLLAHLLNAAGELLDLPRGQDVGAGERAPLGAGGAAVSTARAGEQGERSVLVAGVVAAVLHGHGPAEERFLTALSRWEDQPEVVATLARVLRDLGSTEMVAVWDLPDPAPAREALLAGGLSPSSVAALDRRGPESFRVMARHAGRFTEMLGWSEAVRLVDTAPEVGGPSVAELVALGRPEEAAALTDELVRQASAPPGARSG